MPRKKVATKITKKAKATKTSTIKKTKKVATPRKQSAREGVVEYLKLGESYTSLVLGIIAVIIGTVLLLSFVHSKQVEQRVTPEVTPTLAQSQSFAISPTGIVIKDPEIKQQDTLQEGITYTVVADDNLWIIAQKVYRDGYKWGEIAKANNLLETSEIHVGDKLVIPQIKQDVPTVQAPDDHLAISVQTKIVGNTYKVTPGDTLWGIALRAYGDGYKWGEIAKANNLSNPNVIHTGNVLKIPRG